MATARLPFGAAVQRCGQLDSCLLLWAPALRAAGSAHDSSSDLAAQDTKDANDALHYLYGLKRLQLL